jgi:2-polyprenyl-3-methyl-5-hydroxy-6-metoxy-1,4-benzoquinol methylase
MQVITEHPVASDSVDHLHPWGTVHDNSTNFEFNKRLYKLFDRKISVMDLGCAGGGFVAECHNDGHTAVGIEGSDYSKKNKRASWGFHSDILFTADITHDFQVLDNDLQPMKFDVITMWEVLEHIPDGVKLEKLLDNILKHSKKGTLFIASHSTQNDNVYGVEYHPTVQDTPWWLQKFVERGFVERKDILALFEGHFIRGPPNAPFSKIFVVERS